MYFRLYNIIHTICFNIYYSNLNKSYLLVVLYEYELKLNSRFIKVDKLK